MQLVDTHQHLWNPAQFNYSWLDGLPTLNRAFTLEDYTAATQGFDIAKTIFVECDADAPFILEEARLIQALAEAHPSIAGIVAGGRPAEDGFAAQLDALEQLSKVRGVREVLHTQPDDYSRNPKFREGLRLLPSYNFTFDLCVRADQLPVALELVQSCPDVSFILDHCGIPPVKSNQRDPWREGIAAIATLPNVVGCKISGLVAYADPENWTVADLKVWVDHTIGSFGWDRVMWGGDWPVCTLSASLAKWIEAARNLVSNAPLEAQEKLFSRNAERIYRV